jgi:DNA-binding NarL/FixJ family response regulator
LTIIVKELQQLIEKTDGIDYFDKASLSQNKMTTKNISMKSRPTERNIRRSVKKVKIWIVEDNVFFQKCLIELLDNEPDLVCSRSFNSCEKAIQQLETDSHPSIILLDIELPGMSGLEGIRIFKKLAPSTQVIIITVHEDNDSIFQAICAGAAGYLLKNSPGEKIIEAIHDVQKGGSPINAQIARKVLTAFAALNLPSSDYNLTKREREILQQMIDGLTIKEIGTKLYLSHHTIDTHVRKIYDKLHVNKRSSAITKAIKQRIV